MLRGCARDEDGPKLGVGTTETDVPGHTVRPRASGHLQLESRSGFTLGSLSDRPRGLANLQGDPRCSLFICLGPRAHKWPRPCPS